MLQLLIVHCTVTAVFVVVNLSLQVLGCYALHNRGVGYAQGSPAVHLMAVASVAWIAGMNFVAAALLFEAVCKRRQLQMDCSAAAAIIQGGDLHVKDEAYAFYMLGGFSEVPKALSVTDGS